MVSALHHDLAVEIADAVPGEAAPLARFDHAASVFLHRCRDPDVGRLRLVDAPAVLGPVWDDLDQRWWRGPTERLLRESIDDGDVVAADPRLLATALLGSMTALGRTIAVHAEAIAHQAAAGVLDLCSVALEPADHKFGTAGDLPESPHRRGRGRPRR